MLSRGCAPCASGLSNDVWNEKSRAAVGGAVMHADQHDFVRLHLGEIIPAVIGSVGDRGCFAAHMVINEIACDEVVVREAARIAQREW